MAPRIDQGTIIVLDIGRNVASSEEKIGNSFFLNAKECTARILERKVMTQAKNYVGVILLGSKITNNSMADQCEGAFRHIEVLAPLQTPTWQMIRDLPNEPSKRKGDWFDALIVAADQFKQIEEVNILNKKIILMTNFQAPSQIDEDQVEMVLKGFKEENFEVDVIGLDIYDQCHKGDDIDLARHFVQTTKGASASFEYTKQYLLFQRQKATKAVPWHSELSFGPNVKIPISSYIRLKDEPVVKTWKKAVKDPVTSTSSTTEGVMKNNTNQSNADDIVKGYHYGQQIIPLSDCDKTMLYESGVKSLSVYGFTHASNIKWQNLNGDGLSYVFGKKDDKKAQYAVRCLVECLHELKLVGIVRRVYNNGNAPKMYVLTPVIDTNDFVCLSMIAICFKEDIKNMAFPQTKQKKFACTEEQVSAFKDLIKAMDLTSAYDDTFDDTEAFPIAETVSPTAQYVLDCIAYRAMNPGKSLPQPRDEIMSLFKMPPTIEKRSRDPIDKLKKMLNLKKVEPKQKRRNQTQYHIPTPTVIHAADPNHTNEEINFPKVQVPISNSKSVAHIGTVDPVNDFQTLFRNGKSLVDLAPDMTKAIENLIYCNLDGNYSKAFNTLAYFRNECVKVDPSPYNTWLQTFKSALNSYNKKIDVCDKMLEKKLGLILKKENNLSTFDVEISHEDSQLYENDTMPYDTELSVRPEVNGLFDEI
ncbi:hypothetical protein MSG28_013057 [Choristoneura fumiferana]|uniref:Uncharacterized protein n=1 Tax=Choristoneura fumiferana TaxID=7141 RepID=A0ACC0KSC4_CHOFU|nr:hypothetical protein MSG28_013057 [Choristoneura fumiferana]